jgi:hypothetical protein
MKKTFVSLLLLVGLSAAAQDHFSGISTSSRVGILNGELNPAEFAQLSRKFEVNIYGFSFNIANNKIGFSDLNSDTNLEDLIFTGTDPVNMRFDAKLIGPSLAIRLKKWGFGLTTKANVKFDVVDVDPVLGNAIYNNDLPLNTTILDNPNNQRLNGISYGEVGLSIARTLFDNDKHRFSAGVTFNFLFPGSYSNFGISNLNGTISQNPTGSYLTTNQPANLNIAYSGNLAESFTNFSDYSKSIFGGLNGTAMDIGLNYVWKDGANKYKFKGGLAVKNIGSMTFKDSNNYSTNYTLNIQPTLQNPQGLDLSLFNNIDNLGDVETILTQNGYLTQTPVKREFKVNLPALLALYGDFKIVPKVYVTGYFQQKLNKDTANDQVTALNVISVTPRVNLGFFETYIPISNNDVSGTNVGIGFRLGGFYLGSSSMVTALVNDSKQADLYFGFRWAFL